MADEKEIQSEELDNWKPGDSDQNECSIDCAEDGEDADCCACCW